VATADCAEHQVGVEFWNRTPGVGAG
jgi:hypothetical protein